MCGIAGVLDPASPPERLRGWAVAMAERLHHRGPDAQGVWQEDALALAHRRLSIVDLSEAGAQPMLSACARYVLVFNGEIYNHAALRQVLETEGKAPCWRGHSDTETLLAAIAAWGLAAALRRSSGMFALALWDEAEKRLFLARDRMGEKPLYWGWCGRAFAFASELKALRALPDFPRGVCPTALALYLRFGYVPAPRSIHPGLYKLEPGCILSLAAAPPAEAPETPLRPGESCGTLSITRYWSPAEIIEEGAAHPFTDEDAALTALEGALRSAVASQMVADVPLGAFLSGGVDSSLIVALMQAQSARPVRTFTIGFENPAFNEGPYAAAVARHLGTDHAEMLVTENEARRVIPDLPDLYDEPFADSSQIPTYLVSRAARAHVTVALSGDAGDELFGGYNRYLWATRIWNRLDWMPLPMRQALGRAIMSIPVPAWDGLGRMARGPFALNRAGDKAHKLAVRLQTVKSIDALYRSLVSEWPGAGMVRGVPMQPASVLDDSLPLALAKDAVGRMMFQDMRSYLPDDILCKVDRAAMGVSLETRVPFLDPGVMTISGRLPGEMKIRNGQGKWALRQILYRYVPRQLIERPKSGFGIPMGEWLRGPLKSWASDLLSADSLSMDGLLDPAPVLLCWKEHLSGRRDWTHRLWIILMYVAWRNRYSNEEH